MSGVYGTVKPADINIEQDVEVFYHYRPSINTDDVSFKNFETLSTSVLTPCYLNNDENISITEGLFANKFDRELQRGAKEEMDNKISRIKKERATNPDKVSDDAEKEVRRQYVASVGQTGGFNARKARRSLVALRNRKNKQELEDSEAAHKQETSRRVQGIHNNTARREAIANAIHQDRIYSAEQRYKRLNGVVQQQENEEDVTESYTLTDLDMMNILEANGFEPSIENFEILEEALELGYYSLVEEDDTIKIVPSDSEEEQYDVDEEISGECDEDDKGEVKPEDLHEEDEVKPEDLISDEKEETPEGGTIDQNLDVAGKSEENEEDPTTKLPMDNEPCDAEVKPEDIVVKESVRYTSIKEACMLDEGYFYEDSFLRESAAEKQERLVEQVALIMARESADPLYEELLKTAAYMARLQEGCKKKYGKKAMQEASKIMGEPKETLSENFI